MVKHCKTALVLGLVVTALVIPPFASAADTLDFEDFKDALSLDANTSISFGSYNLSTSGAGALDFGHNGGTKFASDVQVGADSISLQKVALPTDLPTNNSVTDWAYSPDGQYLVAIHSQVEYVGGCATFYKKVDGVYTLLTGHMRYGLEGNGPNIVDNPLLSGCSPSSAEFSSDGNYLAITNNSATGNIIVFKIIDGIFYKMNITGPNVNGSFASISSSSFSNNGEYLAIAHSYSPYVSVYKRSGNGYTKLADPATLPHTHGNNARLTTDANYLVVTHSTSPYLSIYKRSGDVFTKISNPSSLPSSAAGAVTTSPDNSMFIVGQNSSPYLNIYRRSGDSFERLSDPTNLPTGNPNKMSFSSDGKYLAVAHNTSPNITIYQRDGSSFTKLANPSQLPTGFGLSAKFSPDGKELAVGNSGNWETTVATMYRANGIANANISGSLRINHGLIVNGQNTSINSRLTVNSTSHLMNNVYIGDENSVANLSISGSVMVSGGLIVGSTVQFNGLATFAQSVEFVDNALFKDDTKFEKSVEVDGVIKLKSGGNVGRLTINPGDQVKGQALDTTYNTRPVVTGTLAPVELTQALYSQYATAGTCTSTFGDCMNSIKNYAMNIKYTIVPQGNNQFNLYLDNPTIYKLEYSWHAFEAD